VAVWREGIEGHPAYQALVEAEAILDGVETPSDEEELASVNRGRIVVSAVRAALGAIDQQLIPEDLISEISDSASQIRDSSRAFASSGDATHLAPLQTHLDIVLRELTLGAFARPEVVDSLRDSLVRYRQAAGQLVRNLETEVDAASAKAAAADATLAALDERISQAAEIAGSEILAKLAPLETRTAELSDRIVAEGTKVDSLIATSTKEFDDARTEWDRQHLALVEQHKVYAVDAVAESNREAATQRQAIQTAADRVLNALKEQELEARKLVSTIGAIAITGGFGEYAHQQKRRADIWSVLTVASLLTAFLPGAIYLLRVTFGDQAPVDLERFIERIAVGTPLYAIAAYAAVQSARSRDNERRARTMELELAAVGPYLARLSDKDRNAMLLQLTPRYFGQALGSKVGETGLAMGEAVKRIEDASKAP
jgi:hypothetical protein